VDLRFTQFNSGGCQTYLVAAATTDEAWLIDPVLNEIDSYLKVIDQQKLKLTKTIDTHTHADHLSASAKLKDVTGCAYVMHQSAQPKEVTDRLSASTTLSINGTSIKILHTPGHTKDSMCLIFPDRIMTGDTLFLDDGGAGRDDLPGGDPAEHWESLRQLQELPEQMTVYPGHEYRNRKPSTLADQKVRNPFFKPRTQSEYVRFVEELKLGPAEWMKEVLKANCACTRDVNAVHIPQGVSACEVQGTMPTCAREKEVPYIHAHDLKKLIDTRQTVVLLDVRETRELTGPLGHLPGIKHIPIGSISERFPELAVHRDDHIIAICKMGGRAKTAAHILSDAGFNVTVLTGGMNEWNELGLPVKRHL
jgi:glyoxylase-like metal-dependent hydrolase (beta-lactamase superfamily II)/rhodanese-related sulfurtransferase